jgi:hypothetical protein
MLQKGRIRGVDHPRFLAIEAVRHAIEQLIYPKFLYVDAHHEFVVRLVQQLHQVPVIVVDLLDPDQKFHVPLNH